MTSSLTSSSSTSSREFRPRILPQILPKSGRNRRVQFPPSFPISSPHPPPLFPSQTLARGAPGRPNLLAGARHCRRRVSPFPGEVGHPKTRDYAHMLHHNLAHPPDPSVLLFAAQIGEFKFRPSLRRLPQRRRANSSAGEPPRRRRPRDLLRHVLPRLHVAFPWTEEHQREEKVHARAERRRPRQIQPPAPPSSGQSEVSRPIFV